MGGQDDKGRAADIVVEQLAQKIQTGELADGDPLPPERNLMEEFGISRTVVREAVVALSNKGLIETRPRYRPVVRKPGFDAAFGALESIASHLLHEPGGVRNLFETRTFVECGLVREAAKSATKEDLAAMKDALAANEAAIDDSEAFFETDIRFHALLYAVPRNPILPSIHKAYTGWLAPHWSKMPRLPGRNRTNYDAHRKIYEAILMRDPDAAEQALRDHLKDAWEQVHKTLETYK